LRGDSYYSHSSTIDVGALCCAEVHHLLVGCSPVVDAAHLELLCNHFWTAEKMLGGVAVMAAVGAAVVVPLLLQVRVAFHPSAHQSHVRACVWLGGGFILSSLYFCPPCTACHMTDGGFILSSRSVLAIFYFIPAHRAPPVT
jgi:hypothetical protein